MSSAWPFRPPRCRTPRSVVPRSSNRRRRRDVGPSVPDGGGELEPECSDFGGSMIAMTLAASPTACPQPSLETSQGQDHEMSGRGSEDAEVRGARVSPLPPLGPLTRCRACRQAVHRLVQDSDDGGSDVGSESQGSESHLDQVNLLRDENYCPSPTGAEAKSLGDEFNGEDQYPRKRAKVSRSSTSLLRDAAASVERPRRGRPSLRSRSTQSTHRGKNTRASSILSPASSQATPDETEVRADLARFEEWPLGNTSLKRITRNGKTTFQLQFDWTL
ncbi:hypothetical protein EDB81DRAFT_758614 [Dactylonectria macrodidyma]|uniref:Uncharacterized protein n=1 Tax=Dactylonectria macrodidyma TaxID=307937 RepID=A0A9P9J8Q6_9HYPO|nr:hypothetical protein EDB81DRAFT_758614 [Dactylonectria macrodidyma]